MSEPILILGASGTGKTASLRNLNPLDTLLISVDGKRPSFDCKEWGMFSKDNLDGAIYNPKTDNLYGSIKGAMKACKKKIIVIDDSQFMMANSFFARAKEKGYDKFNDLAQDFWFFIDFAKTLPEDTIVYFLHHIDVDEFGLVTPKTLGKMLKDKGSVEGRFTVSLLAQKVDGQHKFFTRLQNDPVVKSPFGMFAEDDIENDLSIVDKNVREFWGL